jgi:hypothetical protein
MIQSDLDTVFFTVSDFAIAATYLHSNGETSSIRGIFDDAFVSVDPVSEISIMSQNPIFKIALKHLKFAPTDHDKLIINSKTYTIRESQPDGVGLSVLFLQDSI